MVYLNFFIEERSAVATAVSVTGLTRTGKDSETNGNP